MIKYILVAMLLGGCSSIPDSAYIKIGAGYKLQETNLTHTNKAGARVDMNDPFTARLELGAECFIPEITCGVSHHSQWLSGAPFNDREEYSKTEVFIDYKINLSELFK